MRYPNSLKTTEERHKFYKSPEWRTLRRNILHANPLCIECKKEGKLVGAVDLHHKKDLKDRPDLALEPTNIIPLCKSCHAKITVKNQEKKPSKFIKRNRGNIRNLKYDLKNLLNQDTKRKLRDKA